MGFTKEEAEALQKRVIDNRILKQYPVTPKEAFKVKARTDPKDRGMNKTEAKYAKHLEYEKSAGRILFYGFESMRIRLADLCGYTPDFMVIDIDGHIEFHDTKAYYKNKKKPGITDDALIKMKVAAEQYPFFRILATWERDGVWEQRVF